MTPGLFVIILLCIFVVIFGQPLLALLADYGVPFLGAIRRRYFSIEWRDVMSRVADEDGDADDIRSGAWGDADDACDLLRGHTHQVNDENETETAADREPLILRQLSKTDLIVMLAVQRKDDGSYLWSSNDIKKFVPGTDGPIGEIIATVRGRKEAPAPGAPLKRPVNGWGKS